jgi:uncharacterized phage-associated protein
MNDIKYDSVDIAGHLIKVCNDLNIDVNNTKLNKLLYIVYGLYIKDNNKSIFSEPVHLWPFGPVFPRVQQRFKNGEIQAKAIENIDNKLDAIINEVVRSYGKIQATKLSEWSHQEGSAWGFSVQLGNVWNSVIDDNLIIAFFRKWNQEI